MAALRKYRIDLGWSLFELANRAGISQQIAKRAEEGHTIKASTAKAIADALSAAMGKDIKPSEIEGLNIV